MTGHFRIDVRPVLFRDLMRLLSRKVACLVAVVAQPGSTDARPAGAKGNALPAGDRIEWASPAAVEIALFQARRADTLANMSALRA